MSNVVIGIIALFHVYCIEIVVCVLAVKLVNKVINKQNTDITTYISSVQTLHIVALIGLIYFNPLVALVICLALDSILVGPIILLLLLLPIWVTNKIIIPISEAKHIQLIQKYYGEDSEYAKFLIEKQQKRH